MQTPTEAEYAHHIYHQYTVRIVGRSRDDVHARMDRAGISTMIYYPVPIHRLPVYNRTDLHVPHVDAAADQVLSLPIWPSISAQVQRAVVDAMRPA